LSDSSSQDNLFDRIRANLREALRPGGWNTSSANGAPIHLLEAARSRGAGRAQSVSFATHAAVIFLIVALALHPSHPSPAERDGSMVVPQPTYAPHFLQHLALGQPDPGKGSGEGHDLTPARSGIPPTISSIQIVKPTIPPPQEHLMPVPPTLLDPNAPPILKPVDRVGIPGGPDNDSSGRGKNKTIGSSTGPNIGNGREDGTGVDNQPGPYRAAAMQPTCLYCPAPLYTDEARHTKLQGTATLAVLVSADGRAIDLRVSKGLGAGLDE